VVFQNNPKAIKRYAPFFKPLAAPTAKIDDDPVVCIKLNEQWLPFVIGAIECLRWDDLYKGTPEEIYFAAQEAARLFLVISLGNIDCPGDAMPKLRQNPSDPCQLQVSYDDGFSWELAFDYSLCLASETTINVTVNMAEIMHTEITNNMAIYEGDITNVYPGWEYGDADDEYRDDALCWAIRQWVDLVCELAIKILHDDLNEEKGFLDQVADTLETVAIMVGLMVTWEFFPIWAAYAAIAFSLASEATEIYAELVEVDPSVFEDDEAKEDVACAIYLEMKGETPHFPTWRDALLDPGLTGNAATIARISWVWQQSEESFVQFMKFVGDMIAISKNGTGLGCPCEGDWIHTWLFTEASGSEPHTTYANGAPQWAPDRGGYFDLNDGGWCSTEEDLGATGHDRVNLLIYLPARTITRVSVEAIYHEGFVPVSKMGETSFADYVVSGTEKNLMHNSFAFQEEGQKGWHWNGIKEMCTRIRVMWRCSWSAAEPPVYGDGDVKVYKIVVEGKGVCPF